jgi:hypothetical protein
MWFGDGSDAARSAADAAKNAVRSMENFNWTTIFFLVVVLMFYFYEMKHKNYKAVYGGLALYSVHWLYEIMNAVICSVSGYALWTVSPESTSYILLIGVSVELSLMFALSGLTVTILPEQKKLRLFDKFTVNTRVAYVIGNAALAAVLEIFLAATPAFIWVYKWWGAVPVFITTYIPFFLVAALVYDAKPKTQRIVVGSLVALNIVLLAVLGPLGVI